MKPEIRNSVIVITGASSGIGRATALELARRGARLVLAARSDESLKDVAEECRRLGARDALAVPTDVGRYQDVEAMARRAADRFGRIDVWVNNAAVSLFGRFEDTPLEAFEQVLRTNLFGYVHGARAALPYFRRQGCGLLINNSSIVGVVGQPYTSAYVVSKFAIRGLSESLRQEFHGTPIEICTVLPATIDTPLFQHAAVYSGRAPKAMPPVYSAQDAAKAIVSLIERPRREVFIGRSARQLNLVHRIAPRLAERIMESQFERFHLYGPGTGRQTPGNLFGPMPQENRVSGGWKAQQGGLVRGLAGTIAALAPVAVGIYYALAQRRRPTTVMGRAREAARRVPSRVAEAFR